MTITPIPPFGGVYPERSRMGSGQVLPSSKEVRKPLLAPFLIANLFLLALSCVLDQLETLNPAPETKFLFRTRNLVREKNLLALFCRLDHRQANF
jgi:hypothetical protein